LLFAEVAFADEVDASVEIAATTEAVEEDAPAA
jgi:hypothetical protein